MNAPTFGRKGSVDGAAMADRRAAFLAAERARAGEQARDVELGIARPAAAGASADVREKSMGLAYLFWFVLGGAGAHRFYLGFPVSGVVQLMLAPLAYGLMLGGSLLLGLAILCVAGLWILADMFIIPSLVREANQRIRRLTVSHVFA